MELHSKNYGAIDLDASNYREIYQDINNYGAIDLNAWNYGQIY